MPVPRNHFVSSGFGHRSGGYHFGADFGRVGGSANMAVFAAQGGTVVYAGAASGFGAPDPCGWVVIDHLASDGGATTVYGHIIREVKVGDRVEAGQRIGRVNPDSRTNGGVPPHLHFEVHPTVWRAGSQIDPMPWLAGALHVDERAAPQITEGGSTLIYGVDISNHQRGIQCQRIANEGFKFSIIKATEGTWKDPVYRSHFDDAKRAGLHVGAYVYVRDETSAEAHARALDEVVNDKTVPIALDIEDGSGRRVDHFRAIKAAIESRGYRVFLTYMPRWYWERIGCPSLSGLPPLWTSRYPDMKPDYASVIYQRSGLKGWEGYGGLSVAVWQFTSSAKVAGYQIDANAFNGSEADLAELFGSKKNTDILGGLFHMLPLERQLELANKIDEIHQQTRSGWPQLGHNSKGQPLTLVDGVSAARHDIQAMRKLLVDFMVKGGRK